MFSDRLVEAKMRNPPNFGGFPDDSLKVVFERANCSSVRVFVTKVLTWFKILRFVLGPRFDFKFESLIRFLVGSCYFKRFSLYQLLE